MTIPTYQIDWPLDGQENDGSETFASMNKILAGTIPQPNADFQQQLGDQLLSVLETQTQVVEPASPKLLPGIDWWIRMWEYLLGLQPPVKLAMATAGLIFILSLAYLATVPPNWWYTMVHEVMDTTEPLDEIATARTLTSATPTATPTSTNTPLLSSQAIETAAVAVQPDALAIPVPLPIATPSHLQ